MKQSIKMVGECMKLLFTLFPLIFCAGLLYCGIGRLDRLRRRFRNNMEQLSISCEDRSHIRVIQPTMDYCSETVPYIDFTITKGHAKGLIWKLMHNMTDLVLLSEECALHLHETMPFLRVSRLENANAVYIDYLVIQDVRTESRFYILWNQSVFYESKERFLFAVKNHFCLLTCGYCDY